MLPPPTYSFFSSSIRRPSFDSFATMPTTIDAAFFPHIIDNILELAPFDCLSHLRVCKDWKRRVDARLYHLTLTETHAEHQFPMPTTYALEGNFPGDAAFFKTSLYRKCEPPPPEYLSAAKVIDLGAPTFKTDIVRILTSASPKVTYRLHEHCNLWSTATWKPHCLVLFAKDLEPGCTVSAYTQYGLRAVNRCEKLVLHVWHSGIETLALSASAQLRNFKRLTIIMHTWPRCRTTSHLPFIDKAGLLIDLGVLGFASSVPTAFVMCEQGEDIEEPWTEGKVQIMRNRITERKEYLVSRGHAVTAAVRVPPPRFVKEEEYRSEVGEEQFEIEMNVGLLSPPSLR